MSAGTTGLGASFSATSADFKVEVVYGQWTYSVTNDGISGENVAPDGTKQFYSLKLGPYGQPLFTQEPDLGIPVPATVAAVNGKGQPVSIEGMRIVGLVVYAPDGSVLARCSLSGWYKKSLKHGEAFQVNADGSVTFTKTGDAALDGKTFQMVGLCAPDKNRMEGHVAFLKLTKSSPTRIFELEDFGASL
ncbi:hypothetical protein IT412_02210 [Candidatus Peregrinibacteria bacterium]|nr:hypothetical protein [Candidatus Peregrinibacteria bacterium]